MSLTEPALSVPVTAIPGLRVGHAHDPEALTGCTVILYEAGAVGGVDQRGGAPGTRETDAMHPVHLVERAHGVVLSGGSAFGLDAASGAVRYLEERGVGFDVRVARVPIVPSAILFDLGIGRADVRPGPEMGYQACLNASEAPPEQGNVGAGMGCTVGKILGMGQAMKSGLGCAAVEIGAGLKVGAVMAVNAFGDVLDPYQQRIVAGARTLREPALAYGAEGYFADTLRVMQAAAGGVPASPPRQNTVIGVVVTNALLNKEQATKVAQMAQDGLARTVRPAHTMWDGDTIFTLAAGPLPADVNTVGAFAAEVVAQAILNAVRAARSAAGLPAAGDFSGNL